LPRQRKFDELNDRWMRLRDNPERDPVKCGEPASADAAFHWPEEAFAPLLDHRVGN
jgi:hypothetical protein